MAAVASEVRARLSDPDTSASFSRQHLVREHLAPSSSAQQ